MMVEFKLSQQGLYEALSTLLGKDVACRVKVVCYGYSMRPLISNGNSVLLKPFYPAQYIGIGEIIAIPRPGTKKIIIHRIIDKKENLFLLKGDNCSGNDGWYVQDTAIGIVERIYKKHFHFKPYPSINRIMAFASKTGMIQMLYRLSTRFLRQAQVKS